MEIKGAETRAENNECMPPLAWPMVKLALSSLLSLVVVLACRRHGHLQITIARIEACAQAASNLTSAQAEFVRQALVAPATVAEVLEILYVGGGGSGSGSTGSGSGSAEGSVSDRGAKRAAACRLNSARVLRSIFSEADASDVARWASWREGSASVWGWWDHVSCIDGDAHGA